MNVNSVAQQLTFQCSKHDAQPMNLYCMSEECEQRGLICALCEEDAHAGHKPTSLKVLLKHIENDLNSLNNGKNLTRFTASIDDEYLKCIRLVEQMQRKEQSRVIRESINNYFGKVREVVLRPIVSDFCKILARLSQGGVKPEDLNAFFQRYKQPQREKDVLLSNYELSVQQLLQEISAKYVELEKAVKTEDKLDNILAIYVYAESEPRVNYQFSETNKHSSHTLSNNNKLIVQKNNYNTNFALIEPPVEGPKKSFKCKSISIKIVRLTSWITIGVCHEKIAKTAAFYFNTASTGHGAYVASHDGYSWHHTTSALNSFSNGWTYQQGDVVTVVWNPKTKTLRYTKNGDETNSYELTYDLVQGDRLCFCVSLSSHDESVEIV